MYPGDFSLTRFDKQPFLIKGSAVVQLLPGESPKALCCVAFDDPPFGSLCECVTFDFFKKHQPHAQLYGFSSTPRLSRAQIPAIDNSHYLIESALRFSCTTNSDKNASLIVTAASESDLLRFEIVAARTKIALPLLPSTTAWRILSTYTQQRFSASQTLAGTFHYGELIAETIEEHIEESSASDANKELARRIAEVFPAHYFAAEQRTYIIDEFTLVMPEPHGLRARSFLTKKRVASSFACDS